MATESRTQKSWLNARMNMICFALTLLLSFFTRKIFLDYLGAEFMGFTGAVGSLLGFLNLAELGVGLAIGYTLYAPLQKQDNVSVCEIVSLLGYLYRWIGIIIVTAGVILSLFLPYFFPDTEFSLGVIYCGYYAYLISSLLGYFINYRACLLSADQRNYVVTGYFQVTSTLKTIVQMLLALWVCNFYLYFVIELAFGCINAIILNDKIDKTYPWLKTELKNGRKLFAKYPAVSKHVKQIFIHQFTGFVQSQTAPLFIYGFVSLSTVALYGNYSMISQRLSGFISGVLNSTSAGVGNLIAEGDKEKIYSIYQELLAFRLFAAAVFSSCVFYLATPFIVLWLGSEYVLSEMVVFLIAVQLFMGIFRGCSDQFLYGYGLFNDLWAPAAEAVIFATCAFVGGSLWGLEGVLLGPVISVFLIVHVWKPIFLFSKGFKLSFLKYLLIVLPGVMTVFIAYWLASSCVEWLVSFLCQSVGWLDWLFEASSFFIIMSAIYGMFLLFANKGFRVLLARVITRKG